MEKQDIKSMTQEELRAFLVSLGEKPFRTAQIYQWMHEKLASSFDDMTNLSKVLRQKLQDACEYVSLEKVRVQISQIDGTRKYLFRLADGNVIESVLMRYKHGNSVCISSQVGCRMGCRFCASTWISRNILTYIRIAMGSRAREDILQVINRPKRYISRDAMPDETVSFEKMKAFYAEKDWIAERIESLEGDLRAIARMSPLAAVNYIRQGMGYDEYLIEYAAFRRMRPEELLETADELKESAAGFKTFDEWFAHIDAYKEELLRQAAQRRTETDAITLATMHSAKGLEFPIVYILDANEGITPHSRAMLDEDMEEERRLFYVAMTRAKTRLHVYAVRERYHKKAEVSRFVWEYLGRES